MFEVFLFHIRRRNNKSVVSKGIVDFYEVFVKFSLIINNIFFEVDIKRRDVGFVSNMCVNIVAVLSYVVDEVIQCSHIVREYALIPLRVGLFNSLYQLYKFL
jgi:hypothetical protein